MQRLHQDDLVGHVLEQEEWEVVSFPAIAEEDEEWAIGSPLGRRVYRRKVGDVLDPTRESLATLNAIRQATGAYNFAAQYQQNPVPVGGNMVKAEWLQFYNRVPDGFVLKVLSLDTANKAKDINDYSVGTVWGYRDGKYYLIDVWRQRVNYPDLKRAVIQLAKKHRVDKVVIEDKASGTQLLQDLREEGLFGLVDYEPPAGTDKVMRLHAQTAVFEQGQVWLPAEAPWLDVYVKELTAFPGGKYDDQVDSTAQALAHMRENRHLAVWAKL